MIAFEHENNRTAYLEVEKLVKIDAPLNVVVTYGSSRTREKDLASCAEVFRKGGRLTGQHLIIHGTLAGDAIDWCYRVWNGNALVAL